MLRPRLWSDHCNILNHFLFKSFRCWFAGVLKIVPLHNWPTFNYWTHYLAFVARVLWCSEEFMVDSVTVRCQGSVTVNKHNMNTPPPPCFRVAMRCFIAISLSLVFSFFIKDGTVNYYQTSPLWSCLNHWSRKSGGLFRCNFFQTCFLLEILIVKLQLCYLFLIVTS